MRSALLLALLLPAAAFADAQRDRFSAGGYFRIMTRPDFQGGDGKLGYSKLYGRLLNEGPYGALELKLDVLRPQPGSNGVWASVHSKLEGGSIANSEANNGRLDQFRVSQLYVKAGNILLDRVTWQLGTLESSFGDLGLYDERVGLLLWDTVGLSALYKTDRFDLLIAVGDSGYAKHGAEYNSVATAGASLRVRLGEHLELGAGAQYGYEPRVPGNRFAPYITPGIDYEDFHRQEVAKNYVEDNPGEEELFPHPEATSASSYEAVGYLGFGKLGPLAWNTFAVNWRRLHPRHHYTETFQGRDYTIYLGELTDERYQFSVGNEMQLRLVPDRLDAAWAVRYGRNFNADNLLAPSEENFTFVSTVLRLQLYLSSTVHLLIEGSGAQEKSENGNLYREHADSVFTNSDGIPDSRGLENGDSDTRTTFQIKGGVVLNPSGFGIYTRPSLRLLYGLQYSSQQAAFGSGFVESLDQYNVFSSPERHLHSVVAIEAEGWF